MIIDALDAHPVWHALQQHVLKNLTIYLENLALLVIAAISTSPEKIPRSVDDMWAWMRDTLRTATPARFGPPSSSKPSPEKGKE